MRTRLSKSHRRAAILSDAKNLLLQNGYDDVDMAMIQRACGLSRGGLYHHFPTVQSMLDAILIDETTALAQAIAGADHPVSALLQGGASLLGAEPGIVVAMTSAQARRTYLSGLDRALSAVLIPALTDTLCETEDAAHIAELIVTVAMRINARVLLGDWSEQQAAGFAATSLRVLAPLIPHDPDLPGLITAFEDRAAT